MMRKEETCCGCHVTWLSFFTGVRVNSDFRSFGTVILPKLTSKMSSSKNVIDTNNIVNDWVSIASIPSIGQGHVTEYPGGRLKLWTQWSVVDYARKENVSFVKNYIVDNDGTVIDCGLPVTSSTKLTCFSKSGQRAAHLVEGPEKDGQKPEVLQIWNSDTLLKFYDLKELDQHKNVYKEAELGCTMAWSPDEKKLAYIAEKKPSKTEPFFKSYVKKDDKDQKGDNGDIDEDKSSKVAVERGEEYRLKQSWGEQLKNYFNSVIVILDLETDKFTVLELPETDFPTDIQWLGNDRLVANSVTIPIWRLGLIFCSNREARIFVVDIDGGNHKYLSAENRNARSPRVRPGDEYVVWVERACDGPHERAKSAMAINLTSNDPPFTLYSSNPSNGVPLYARFPRNCWSPDGKFLFTVTPNDAEMAIVRLSLDEDPLVVKSIRDCNGILWMNKDKLVIVSSNTLEPPSVQLVDMKEIDKDEVKRTAVSKPISFLTDDIDRQLIDGVCSPRSVYYGPKSSNGNLVPLVVIPHGGPHSILSDVFMQEISFLLKQGFGVLRINYIGSIAGTQDVTDDLLGYVGDKDVKDCQFIVEKTIKQNPNIDPKAVFVCGGSHGGFLGAHLISSYPDFYRAAVLRNPVTDFNTMIGMSDIVDWSYAEAGILHDPKLLTYMPTTNSLEEAEKYRKCSPITYVDKVKAPTLLLLGSEDLRVPMYQGMSYYRALKALGKTAEVRVYDDNHALGKPQVHMDKVIHCVLWYKKYLNEN